MEHWNGNLQLFSKAFVKFRYRSNPIKARLEEFTELYATCSTIIALV